MDVITLDFESYFDKGYSLSGLTYVEYLFDERFLLQGVGVQINDGEPEYFPEHEVESAIDELDLENSTLVLQNAKFDASILAWKFDRYAKHYVDTMDLARAYWPGQDASLEIICQRLWPNDPSMQKGKELASFKGIRHLDDEQQAVMGGYCKQDVRLTYAIYRELIDKIPESEIRLAEMTLRMYIDPPFVLDRDRVERYLEQEKQHLKEKVKASGLPKTKLSSNKQFAEWMREQGIEVPQKVSPTTGKMTDALGQKDPVFLRTMADHPDHQAIWEARAAVKSTIGATRAKRLLDLDDTLGRIPTPLSFWGAHCVPGETEVLTHQGWRRIDEWGGGEIAQVSPDRSIQFAHADRFEGPDVHRWVSSNNRYAPMTITMGHTVPYLTHGGNKWATMKGGNVFNRSSIRLPTAGFLRSDTGVLTPEQIRVLVMIQADGHFTEHGQLQVFVKKDRKKSRVRKLLGEAGIHYEECEFGSHPDFIRYVVSANSLPEWINRERKLFGPWLLDTTQASREAFIEEIPLWDGWMDAGKYPRYSTSDWVNAEWVMTIAHLTGRTASYGTTISDNPNRKGNYTVSFRNKPSVYAYNAQWYVENRTAKSYCTITQTGFWLARHKGRIFITGNTGRWSGTQKLNLQNLPRGGELRKALCAPPGYKVHVADSSQIEARMLAWLAGQMDLLDDFRHERDIYSKTATKIYGYEVDRKFVDEHGKKPFQEEGNVGKTCLAEGSLVLTPSGWKPIEQLTLEDRVWDGIEWVTHSGVVFNGCKKTLNICGLSLTPDHLVLCGTQWKEAQSLAHDANTLSRALARGSENLPSQATCKAPEAASPNSLSNATAVLPVSIPSTPRTSRVLGQRAARYAPVKLPTPNATGSMPMHFLTMDTVHAYLTAFQRLSAAATSLATVHTPTTALAGSTSTTHGERTAPLSWLISRPFRVGMTRLWKWIATTTAKVTSPAISFFPHAPKTVLTEINSQKYGSNSCSSERKMPVYDVTSAGPRNRFTVWSQSGPLIVHNCVLGLGYGMGAPKFRATLASGPMGAPPILVSERFAQTAVDVYRADNPMIVAYWATLNRAMYDMMLPKVDYWIGPIRVRHERLELPNGMALKYPNLRVVDETDADGRPTGRSQVICDRKNNTTQKLYGGILVENCIAHDTPVLTQRGWVPIQGVQTTDFVHDGIDWVRHDGLINKGVAPCTIIDGVYMTPDHEVLTDEGWQAASQDPRPHRPTFRQVDLPLPDHERRQETQMGTALRLRHGSGAGRHRGRQGLAERARHTVPYLFSPVGAQATHDTRYEQTPRVRRLALHDRPLSTAYASGLAQLRRARDHGLRALAVLRSVLGGYGPQLCHGIDAGSGGQRWPLLPRELPLGGLQGPGGQSPLISPGRHCQSSRTDRDRQEHAVLPLVSRPVYDIRNAGPRSRFVVRGDAGPFVVHNCTQAMARIVVSDQILAAVDAFPDAKLALAVHDEIVMIMPDDNSDERQQHLEELMRVPPSWAKDLPLNSEGGYDHNYSK